MATKKKTASKSNKTTDQIRKEAIAQADKNIAAIEAKERGETPPAEESKPVRKKAASSRKKTSTASKATKGAKSQQKPTSAAKDANAKTPKPQKEKRLSGLDHAANVLAAFKEPLNATAIAERAIEAGWKTNGATPHATLYAAMIREITTKGAESRFKKVERGLFTATGKGKK